MTRYNPNIHNRRSIRLKGYDYSQAGLYFITICCQNRAHLFGEVVNKKMILNDAGKIANQCWLDIPKHFPNVILHNHIIMPNHVHGIIEIAVGSVGVGAKNFSPLPQPTASSNRPRGTSRTIGSMVRGFKIGVTKWMRQNTDVYNVWQRNYWESIIWDEPTYIRISDYIRDNPAKWKEDKFFSF